MHVKMKRFLAKNGCIDRETIFGKIYVTQTCRLTLVTSPVTNTGASVEETIFDISNMAERSMTYSGIYFLYSYIYVAKFYYLGVVQHDPVSLVNFLCMFTCHLQFLIHQS